MKGIYSALMVPYNEDGSINEKGLREIIRYNIDKMKVDGLYVGGSTGENFLISTEEKKRIFKRYSINQFFIFSYTTYLSCYSFFMLIY